MPSENTSIEDFSESWKDLSNFCIYWRGNMTKIPNIQKFFDANNTVKDDDRFFRDSYYVILRTTYAYDSIISILYSLFSKIFSIDVSELAWDEVKFENEIDVKPRDELMAYSVKFDVIRPNLWNPFNLSKMVFYSLSLLELLDYKYCPPDMQPIRTLGDILFELLHLKNSQISQHQSQFFHRGMAELITTLRNLQARSSSHNWRFLRDGPQFLNSDASGITFVLQSRRDINDAISRVNEYDSTYITNEILTQYETMRRNF